MKKKTEVIEILNQGGRIMVDTIYRTARVYTAAEWESDSSGDSCRYDVAEKLTQTAGYKKVKTDWYASYHIVKETAAEPEKTAAEWEAESERVHEEVSAWGAQVFGAAEEAAPAAEAEEEAEPDYLKEAWPESNVIPGICYILEWNTPGSATKHTGADSVEDVRSHIQQIKHLGGYITKAVRFDRNAGSCREFIPETRQEKTDRENWEHCKSIAETLEAYADGNYYKCPECGEEIEFPAGVGDKFKCTGCGNVAPVEEYEQMSLYDFLSDTYDIEYRCDSKREYRSVCIMVAYGGPNIYIDTSSKAVELYWWTDRAKYPLSSDAVDAVDAWAEEYWNCY